MSDIDIKTVTHLIYDIRDGDDGDRVVTVKITPKLNTWKNAGVERAFILAQCGAKPGSCAKDRSTA